MSIIKWTPAREKWVVAAEISLAEAAAKMGKNIVVDDTNLMPWDEVKWRNTAKQLGCVFQKIVLEVSLEECVARDAARTGYARLGRPTIERQFLRAGLWKIPADKQTVIFDIDGTLADLEHRVPWLNVGGPCPGGCTNGQYMAGVDKIDLDTSECTYLYKPCPYCVEGVLKKKNHDEFYARVPHDQPIDIVVRWIQACYETFHVLIVSGRSPEKCGEETVAWLAKHEIPYHHIIMRRSNMHGPDDEEKQLILNDILKMIPKEQIAFVVDDRPSVVAMWKRNGLKVIPVRGRDDDKFYAQMSEAEATWPRPELEGEVEHCNAGPEPRTKKPYKRPLSSYVTQVIKRAQRWRRK